MESTWLPPQTPQAMSTQITDVPESTAPMQVTQDSVPYLLLLEFLQLILKKEELQQVPVLLVIHP